MPPKMNKSVEMQKPSSGRILLVDDEERLARNLSILLAREGYRVDVAGSGANGLALLKQNHYDLVVTDLIMPGVDGFQLMEFVRGLPEEIPVVVITGYGSMESAIWAIRQGAADYLPKPLDFEMMKIAVEKALEKKRLKDQLREYTEHLEEKVLARTRDLEEAQMTLMQFERLAAIGELVSVITHEIRNPLVAVGGFARRLKNKANEPEEVMKLSAIIVDEVERLEKILKEMLDFSKEFKPNRRPEFINDLIQRTVILSEGELKRHGISLTLDLAERLPEIMVDPDQIRGVLLNFFTNAIEAMPRGGALTVRTFESESGMVVIEVVDTGVGIAAENLKKIFHAFFSTKSHGTGLGLAIAQKVVQAHDGKIEVQSSEGVGSTFRILLPKAHPKEGRAVRDKEPKELTEPRDPREAKDPREKKADPGSDPG